MKYRVVLTESAASEMENAADRWASERSVEQAERWYAGIRLAIDSLDELPDRYPLATEHADFDYELRELHFGLGARPTHRVVFTIVRQTVVILAVRHGAQDALRPEDF